MDGRRAKNYFLGKEWRGTAESTQPTGFKVSQEITFTAFCQHFMLMNS